MLDDHYLAEGITALSRCQQAMDGHAGAAVLAAYFFSRENDFEAGAETQLQKVLDDAIARNARGCFAGPAADGTNLFAPRQHQEPDPALGDRICSALASKISQLQASGHCTIFASLALKGLNANPLLSTPAIVEGICQLIGKFDGSPGKGYYGEERGWLAGVPVDPEKHLPPYQSIDDLVATALNELVNSPKVKTKGYGALVHLVTHTNALVELHQMGHGDLAQQAFAAHQTHIMLLRSLPPETDDNGVPVPLKPNPLSPLSSSYWRNFDPHAQAPSALNLGGADHAIKVSYAFFHLCHFLKDNRLKEQALAHLGYIT